MKTKYLTIAALAAIVASCSNDEEFIPQVDNLKDTPITVTAGVAELTTRAGYETNKEDDTQSVLPKTFYLSITQDTEDATSEYNYTNVPMTKAEDDNTYSAPEGTTLLWKDSNRDVAVNAYTTDAETFTVQTDQSTDANVLASDLLGAVKAAENSDISVGGDNITIDFRHLLCKLDVTFSWGTEFNAATEKTIKSVKYLGFGTDVTLDRKACTVAAPTEQPTDDIQAYVTTADEGVTYLSEAIFAPYVGTAPSIFITAMIDNVERDFAIGVNAPAGGFASGNRYTMNVTIGGTAVEDGSVTATLANGWENGDANDEEEGTTGNMATN